jgi:hypothetical protein
MVDPELMTKREDPSMAVAPPETVKEPPGTWKRTWL